MSSNPPGWYPDPTEPGKQRYWDGTSWTDKSMPAAPSAGNQASHERTNGLAIASFVLSLLTLCGIGSLLGVVFGHISLGQIKRGRQRGRGLAIAGLVLGYLGLAGIVVLIAVAVTSSSDEQGVTAESPGVTAAAPETTADQPVATEAATSTTAGSPDTTADSPATTSSPSVETTAAPTNGDKPIAVSGFTTYDALGEAWASVGIVLSGLTGGSQELTISLLDAAGTPISTNTEFLGFDGDGGEVLVASSFIDDVSSATSVRVDVTNASSFIDSAPFPVTVTSYGFDGNFWTVQGTATNDTSENIEFGTVTCVAFRAGQPVAGTTTFTSTMVPGAQVAFEATETFDPQADEVRCQGEA